MPNESNELWHTKPAEFNQAKKAAGRFISFDPVL
jgi:hypothetical protein